MALELWPQFTGGSYTRTSGYTDSERTVNLYPETSGKGENNRSTMRLQTTPGLTLAQNLNSVGATGPVWDVITISYYDSVAQNSFSRTFALVQKNSQEILMVEYLGTSTPPFLIGTALTFPTGVPAASLWNVKMIPCAGNQILSIAGIRSATTYFSGSLYGNPVGVPFYYLQPPSTPGWLGAIDVDAMDGYVIAAQPNSQTFYISGLQSPQTYDPLDFAIENDAPDYIVGLRVLNRDLFIFGRSRVLVWNNTGASGFPFSRNNSVTIDIGCINAKTIVRMNNTLFWLGRDRSGGVQAWKLNGYNPLRISTAAIEAFWQNILGGGSAHESVFDDIRCWGYQEEGHTFYVVMFPSQGYTWVLDDTEGMWHERQQGNLGGCIRQQCHTFNPNYGHIVGDKTNANLYIQSRTIGTELTNPITRLRNTPHLFDGSNRNFHKRMVLDISPSVVTANLQYSNDGGVTFGPSSAPAITDRGSGKRYAFNRLGSGLDRVYSLSCNDTGAFSIAAAYIDVAGSQDR